jgi:hypothetical protein
MAEEEGRLESEEKKFPGNRPRSFIFVANVDNHQGSILNFITYLWYQSAEKL